MHVPSHVHARGRSRPPGGDHQRGQSLVEFALVVPVLLLLVLFALDFGRIFMGWITLNNMARVGANYAANHPDAWANGNTTQQQEYLDLIAASYDLINCTPEPATPPDPVFAGSRQPGDPVTVALQCNFEVLTPVIGSIVGNGGVVTVSASSSFPVGFGCIADCGGGGSVIPPTPADNCRVVPNVVGLSVLGARNAWTSAGFSEGNFRPGAGSDDALTVDSRTLDVPPNDEGCPAGEAFVFASVTVTTEPSDPPACPYVPNLLGMTVEQGRVAWTTSGLGGTFTPATGFDSRRITDQLTTPNANPGDCPAPPVDVEIVYGSAYSAPPPAPCRVPNFANTASGDAGPTWSAAGFTSGVTFKNTDKLPYTIKAQSLVGNTYVSCGASITLSNTGSAK